MTIYQQPALHLSNKYSRWHNSIISRAFSEKRTKSSGVYYESHHIVPRSLGGTDDFDNRVLLTAKEHFIIHLLLIKMFDGSDRRKMMYAIHRMTHSNNHHERKYTSAQYEIAKDMNSKAMRGNKIMNGRKLSDKTKKRMSDAKIGNKNRTDKFHSEESRKMMSLSHRGKTFSTEHKNKLRVAQLGKMHSDETKDKLRESRLNMTKKICPHCLRELDHLNYQRWHGDNCKHRIS